MARASAASASTPATVRSAATGPATGRDERIVIGLRRPGRGRRPEGRRAPRSRPAADRDTRIAVVRLVGGDARAPRRSRPCLPPVGRVAARRAPGGRPAPTRPAPRRARTDRDRLRSQHDSSARQTSSSALSSAVPAAVGPLSRDRRSSEVVVAVVLGRLRGRGRARRRSWAPSRARASSASACRARSSASSSSRAVSGTMSATNASVGTNLMPVCLPTVERSTPVALASAAAESAICGLVAVDGVEHRGLAEVAGHPGVGDGDHAQPGVLDLHLDRGGDDLADAHRQLAGAGRVGHRTSSERAPGGLRGAGLDSTSGRRQAFSRRCR